METMPLRVSGSIERLKRKGLCPVEKSRVFQQYRHIADPQLRVNTRNISENTQNKTEKYSQPSYDLHQYHMICMDYAIGLVHLVIEYNQKRTHKA